MNADTLASADSTADPDPDPDGAAAGPRPARRYWSARRNTATLTALVVLGAAGALLYEEINVRAGRPADPWRIRVSAELAQRHLDDPWVIGAAAVACALGLWLLILAATPGLRRLLPLAATGTTGVRAALDRGAAAAMLRRAALEAPGVRDAKVTVGRRRARIRAVVGFGDREEVHAALTDVLSAERERLGLVRAPMVNVTVRGRS